MPHCSLRIGVEKSTIRKHRYWRRGRGEATSGNPSDMTVRLFSTSRLRTTVFVHRANIGNRTKAFEWYRFQWPCVTPKVYISRFQRQTVARTILRQLSCLSMQRKKRFKYKFEAFWRKKWQNWQKHDTYNYRRYNLIQSPRTVAKTVKP